MSREEERKRNGKTVVNVNGSAHECFLSRKSVERPRDSYVYGRIAHNAFVHGNISTGTSIEINSSIYRSFDNNIMPRE